jgi:hypothetical protein
MSVLKSPTLILPEELASGTSVLPTITWELIEQEILETLYQVLHYLHPVADTDASIVNVLNLPSSKSKAHVDFFERTFPGILATEKPAICVEHTGEYQLVIDLSKPLNVGSLVSFLAFVVNFHFTKQLGYVFIGSYDLDNLQKIKILESSANSEQALKADNLQPIIFQYLKKVFLDNGFKDFYRSKISSSGDKDFRVSFNRMFFPGIILIDFIKVIKFHAMDDPYISINNYKFNYLGLKKKSTDLEKVNETYIKLFNELNVMKQKIFLSYLEQFVFKIFNNKISFDEILLGSGNGSDTIGFFDLNNFGALFFQYKVEKSSSLSTFNLIPTKTNVKSLKSSAKGKSSIINLNVFGVNESATSPGFEPGYGIVEIAVKGHICRIDFKKEFGTHAMVAKPEPIITTKSVLNSNHSGFGLISSVSNVAGTSTWHFYEKSGDTIPVFTFNDQTFELSYESDGVDVGIYVNSVNGEEFFLIASVVENILKQFKFELVNLFENDRFELSKDTRDNLFLKDVSPKDLLEIAKLFSLDSTSFEKIYEVSVVGNFIGKKDTNGVVVTDKDYTIYRTTTSTHTATSKVEQFIPPTSGSESDLYYAKLRYSKGSVEYSLNKLKIYIESFVSPLRSRLDKRILGPNLDSTGNPETDIFDYRPTLAGRKADVLDIHTLFGSGVSPDAYLLMNENEPFDATSNPTLASYNQLLSALRSLGVLEALMDRILARANEELAKSISDVTRDANDLNTTNIMNNIQIILSNVKCATIRESEDPTSTIKKIDINTYRALKWYVSPNDKNRFDHTN